MSINGLRLLFTYDKPIEEQQATVGRIQAAIKELAEQNDIYQIELNITYPWQKPTDQSDDQP